MSTDTFDARGAARALKAAIAGGSVDVSSLYGGKPGGPRIACPLHGGDSPNFELYEDGGWRCHSRCGSGGDVFHFVAIRELNVVAGQTLRGETFTRAVRLAFERLGVDLDGFAIARAAPPPGRGKKRRAYPPAGDVARLLANAHEPPATGEPFAIGGRARPGVGTCAVAAGLALCVVLGEDVRKLRPKWAARWPAGKLFALYDARGSLATVHLRPDDVSKGRGKNPPKFNPVAFLMNEPARALVRGESADERNRARLLGYETARQSARSDGVLLVEGAPTWCAWTRWHPGPVLGLPGQEPTQELLSRLPVEAPILLDFDPDPVGYKYLVAALRGLTRHEDVRVSARMRWIIDRALEAKRDADLVEAQLTAARKTDPRLLDPDELADGPRVESAGFTSIGPEERIEIIGQGASYGAQWIGELRVNDDGRILATEGNLVLALKLDERWLGVLGLDERSGTTTILRKPPVPDIAHGSFPREIRDEDITHIAAWYEKELALAFSNAAAHRAVDAVAALHPFDRVREYLLRVGTLWDGEARLDAWLPRYVGADDTRLTRAVGAMWLISAVARTLMPGCKADHVLVLEGEQGTRKSSAFAALCPERSYFTDAIPDLRNEKSASEIVTSGVWICELAELDSIGRADISAVKAFITRREERYRAAYKHYVRTQPRRVVFCASTNEGAYLRDQTGNRRFWPVRVGEIDLEGLVAARDQLWAEAVVRYQKGEAWHIRDARLAHDVRRAQDARREVDPWEPPIEAFLEEWREAALRFDAAGKRLRLDDLPGQCLEKLDLSVKATTLRESRRINAILRRLGWERMQRRDGEKVAGRKRSRRWAWEPTEAWLRELESPSGEGGSPGSGGRSPGDTDTPGDTKNPTISSGSPGSPGSFARAGESQETGVRPRNGSEPQKSLGEAQDGVTPGDPRKSPTIPSNGSRTPGDPSGSTLNLDLEDDFDPRGWRDT